MIIAGHTLGTPNQSVTEAIRLFAAADLNAAEIIWQDQYRSGIPEKGNQALLREIRAVSAETGVPVIGLTPYMDGLNSTDEGDRSRDIERFNKCIADAAYLNASVVRVYAGAYTPMQESERPELWERLVLSLKELGPIAEASGITLAVENHFNTMTVTAKETMELITEVNSPAVQILYDQANLEFTHSESYERAIDLQGGHIRHVHAKDLVFVDRNRPFSASEVATVSADQRAVRSRVVGEGEMNWAGIIAQLLDHGYASAISLEYEYRWHPQDLPSPLEGFRRAAARIRAWLDGPDSGRQEQRLETEK